MHVSSDQRSLKVWGMAHIFSVSPHAQIPTEDRHKQSPTINICSEGIISIYSRIYQLMLSKVILPWFLSTQR